MFNFFGTFSLASSFFSDTKLADVTMSDVIQALPILLPVGFLILLGLWYENTHGETGYKRELRAKWKADEPKREAEQREWEHQKQLDLATPVPPGEYKLLVMFHPTPNFERWQEYTHLYSPLADNAECRSVRAENGRPLRYTNGVPNCAMCRKRIGLRPIKGFI